MLEKGKGWDEVRQIGVSGLLYLLLRIFNILTQTF
jgi:hypothetical protein